MQYQDNNIIDNLLKRKNYKYIQNYKLYELTHCISYESAIRNEQVKLLIKLLDELSLEHKQMFVHMLEDNKLHTSRIEELLSKSKKLIETYTDYNILTEALKEAPQDQLLMMYITQLITILEEEYFMVYDRKVIIDKSLHKLFEEPNHFEADLELNKHMNSVIAEHISEKNDDKSSYKSNDTVKDCYSVYQGSYEGNIGFNFNKIFPNFEKPMREFNQTQITLNISLPKKELLAFISTIKDDYDAGNSAIKNPYQFHNVNDNLDYVEIKKWDQNEWANNFFIYDYFKISHDKDITTTRQIVQEILTEYNGVKVLKTDIEIRKSRNKGDNSKYKIISYETYMTDYHESIGENPINKIYKKEYKEHKPFYSIDTIIDRLRLMTILIDKQNYKTLILR